MTELQCVLWALEKKASSVGRYGEWRSEPQFQGFIPSPSPDVSKLQRERKHMLKGHRQEREISLRLAWDPVREFWLYVVVPLVNDDASRGVFLCG